MMFLLMLISSCSDNDRQNVKKDIDTVKTSLQKNVDTLQKKLMPGDTLFSSVEVKEVIVSQNVSKDLHDNLEDVFSHYIEIKEQLADNDSIDTKKHANEMLESVTKAAAEVGKDIDRNWSMEKNRILKYQKTIETTNTLQQQRDWFNKLTVALTEAIQRYGIPGKTVYELESVNTSGGTKGLKWLTDSKNSDNPYAGKDDDEYSVRVIRGWDFKNN